MENPELVELGVSKVVERELDAMLARLHELHNEGFIDALSMMIARFPEGEEAKVVMIACCPPHAAEMLHSQFTLNSSNPQIREAAEESVMRDTREMIEQLETAERLDKEWPV